MRRSAAGPDQIARNASPIPEDRAGCAGVFTWRGNGLGPRLWPELSLADLGTVRGFVLLGSGSTEPASAANNARLDSCVLR